jgi:hypothetical protein
MKNQLFMNRKNFSPPLELGGPWEGLGTKTPLPIMHSLAQTMRNKPYLRRNKKINSSSSSVNLQPSSPA